MSPEIKSIDHVHVSVVDRTAAEEWYKDVLGLTRVKELEFWSPNGGPLTIQNREATVHLALFEGAPQKRPATVAFAVGAVAFGQWQAHLAEALGKEYQPEDHAVSWSLYFNDPDGNRYEITTYDYAAVQGALSAGEA